MMKNHAQFMLVKDDVIYTIYDNQKSDNWYLESHTESGSFWTRNVEEAFVFNDFDEALSVLYSSSSVRIELKRPGMTLQPSPVHRCQQFGTWSHPQLPDFGENSPDELLNTWGASVGVQITTVLMEKDIKSTDELFHNWFIAGDTNCSSWQPTQPDLKSFLVSIHDTEIGPIAWWATPNLKYSEENRN
ncbi:hypothetical protein L4174_023960 (plasmid) [Photobacterium sp. CCB-ST2H9]|uniref:hypothetical protein n=1 Tax=Photobacterium sp. CCB-ST2H9 TaxID=2912855 RepID=UPI0020063F5A|nr:hypothetical protein [Photobacterium sp. CCB-ST2H9]UTM60443.1 hypothetical protein L4174_023960 [Photobacterium sp. CCB-ST2H9]